MLIRTQNVHSSRHQCSIGSNVVLYRPTTANTWDNINTKKNSYYSIDIYPYSLRYINNLSDEKKIVIPTIDI